MVMQGWRKMRMVTQGENIHARRKMVAQGVCKVRIPMQRENAHMRWECGHGRYDSPSEILHSLIFFIFFVSVILLISQYYSSILPVCILHSYADWNPSHGWTECSVALYLSFDNEEQYDPKEGTVTFQNGVPLVSGQVRCSIVYQTS